MEKIKKLSGLFRKYNVALAYVFGSQRKYPDVKYLFDKYFEEALDEY
ncbi:hypothetical protein [Thermodesulfovibrio yellowstonii]|uniref:Polymerase beta nucleotidyltransferase domain-containing protein n=1 Tax=Thermodesulfovibrio yellowstonii TaxID=28262 RepID=A0A9W6GFI3_9BACT|nr:hypothetical protein [Thermodesulfovibrio islandicus]GLI52927.1 hypothetical protein TISLANDTSLP1_06200 [Thermodesulfovibrio islandicus]